MYPTSDCVFVDSEPAITAGKHVTCINQRTGVLLTCEAEYSGSNLMFLVMTWTTSSGLLLANGTSNFSSLFMSSICLSPSPSPSSSSPPSASSSLLSYTCTVSFAQPIANTVFRGVRSEYYQQKSNAPSLIASAASTTHSQVSKYNWNENSTRYNWYKYNKLYNLKKITFNFISRCIDTE